MALAAKKQNGFTIVELLIVIVVIGILAAIVVSTYSGIQAKRNNTKRQNDIELIQDQLEAFYSQNGYYPSLSDMNSTTWRTKNMPNLSSGTMVDPSSNTSATDAKLATAPAAKVYSYKVTDSNGNPCENDDTNCAKYTLTATYQGTVDGSTTYAKQNLD